MLELFIYLLFSDEYMIGDGSCQKCPSGCISCSSDKNCTCCSHGRYVAFPCYLKKII